MGDYSSTPKRTPEDGDEVFGWDDSAGEEAFFPIGASEDAIPNWAALEEGFNRGGRRQILGRFIPGGGNDHYLALIKKGSVFRNISGILTPGATSGPVGDRVAFVSIALGQDDGGDIRGGMRAMGTFSPIELVQFDADGSSWIGLRAANVQTLATTGLSSAFFTGSVNDGFVWEAQTFASSAVTNVAALPSGLQLSGAPGDPIGNNQSLHISGSPGTSKEVMVDGNGFIVEV